jgi:hypothetical protein
VVGAVRKTVPHYAADRYLANELAWAKEAVLDGRFAGEAVGLFEPAAPG